ncbi:YhcH/YjgK/YiaL family protein [Streptococcus danieliae]|uniref:YhcH/YjgK/YiaL family protein n=1 Tax=Streptococcus danieliae TaxID=747656 RepID=A0A7X3G9A0_9STRE|nr:YhcH/YjgK/YiaL family protein [Streptococcus danieliae]
MPHNLTKSHKKYLDIHLVVSNTEKMAVSAAVDATLKVDFDTQQDIGFYDSEIYQMVTLTESNLLVTFEEDLHQPKIRVNDEPVRKLVIKVLNAEV